jgi:hypothetical protein
MPYADVAKNAMLDELASLAVFASLHTSDTPTAGGSEVSGGSPAYARKAITWNAATSGSIDSSNAPVFDVPSGTTVKAVGFWSAATNGTFYGYSNVTDEVFANQGTYSLTDADLDLNA